MREGEQLLPSAKLFYGDPSTYLWEDEVGDVHHIRLGEGGAQGDALMPMLFCLGQHGARAIAERLLPGEKLFAHLDDLYVVCQPDRVGDVHTVIGQELWRHAKISVHHWKTKVWNRGGTCPDACAALTEARMVDLGAVVWRGDTSLPRREQGLVILGAPVGQVEFVQLEKKTVEHSVLLQRIPLVKNLQAAWYAHCESPELGEAFATGHDDSVRACLGSLLNVCRARAQLRADDDQPSITHRWFGAPQCSETLPSRSLG